LTCTDSYSSGNDNFAADRQVRAIPQLPWLARQNRDFLRRTVRFLAAAGITQFLDIGSGLPTNQNVHEVAQPWPGCATPWLPAATW
jgi:S-adenosyl methyltransferase